MSQANMTQTADIAYQMEEWRNKTLADLIRYIVAKHHTYLREELPAIESLFTGPPKNPSASQRDGLIRIFRQFRREMEEHMKKEEAILFPMIERLENAICSGQEAPRLPFGSIGHPIAVMEEEHERARKELAEIRTFTGDYTRVTPGAGEQTSALNRLKALDDDMEIHSRLEDEILFPRAIGLERV